MQGDRCAGFGAQATLWVFSICAEQRWEFAGGINLVLSLLQHFP
jgi:hypothetical protein